MSQKIWIPVIAYSTLNRFSKIIKIVMDYPDLGKHYIKLEGLYKPLTWDPEPLGPAEGLKKICDIKTYHRFVQGTGFTPTFAEVIAQIPEHVIKKVVAFEIIKSPVEDKNMHKNKKAYKAGYLTATTRLYSKEE